MELSAPIPMRNPFSLLSPPPPFRKLHRHLPPTTSGAAIRRRSCLLSASAERKLEGSWIPADGSSDDGFGGWSVTIRRIEEQDKNDSLKFVAVGVGTVMALALAAFGVRSFKKKGFKFRLDASLILHELLLPSKPTKSPVLDKESSALEVNGFKEAELVYKTDVATDASKAKEGNPVSVLGESKHVVVPVAADSTQQEALFVLKKLRIIENDADAKELCTRREFARWLVKANSMLERNPKYRIVPSISVADSTITAFDDVSANDPDFWCIQALGEAGIVFSKLSAPNSSSFLDAASSDASQGRVDFSPDSLISRFDLVNWKALLEYFFTYEMDCEMLRKKVCLLDLSTITPNASPQLLTDLMADDKSITRRTFGNIRRLQPAKPVTKAQAAVAITSGRMAEAIHAELSRIDAENLSRFAEMEEIRSELIHRGDIQRLWEGKLKKEKDRGFEVEEDLNVLLDDFEKEKRAQSESFPVYLKDKAALECQQQLLLSLREEVDVMRERLSNERANLISEQQSLEKLLVELHEKQEAVMEAKSFLEAEKEAIQIFRSWLEEEARRIHRRAQVLEQAAQRWKWSDESGVTDQCSPENQDSQPLQGTKEINKNVQQSCLAIRRIWFQFSSCMLHPG